MVPGIPDKPEEPGPNPQSCDIGYSQSRPQGWLGHFQEGQKAQNQVHKAQEDYPLNNFSVVDLPLVKSIDGLSNIGLQCFHCILTQQF